MTLVTVDGIEELQGLVGDTIGPSEWREVTQAQIDRFAEVSGDRQWIHVDPERASKESPFGTTVAHGFLTLSLLPGLQFTMGVIPEDISQAINYGLDKLRFVAPVRVGKRVRYHTTLMSVEEKGPGRLVRT